jgi:biopolymer transport protein ExbD
VTSVGEKSEPMKIKSKKPAVADVDMTPMIDIVFQLIAFFMVITNFEQIQADERVKLPSDSLAKPPEVKAADELVLNIGFERNFKEKLPTPKPIFFITVNQFQY